MLNIFVYGTLMYENVWNRIVNGEFNKIKGTLTGYKRLSVRGEEYPGLIRGDDIVEGYILFNVDSENVRLLDAFEGEYYQRVDAMAIDEAGREIAVQTYLFRDEYRHLLDDTRWSVDEFEKSGMKKFSLRYVGFEKI